VNQRVLAKDDKIKERWNNFHKLFDENHIGEPTIETNSQVSGRKYRYIWKSRFTLVKNAPKEETEGGVGLDVIPIGL